MLIDGGGPSNGNPDAPNGVYQITDGSAALVADLSTWVRENPVSAPPEDFEPDGSPYAMVAGDGALWIVEVNFGQVLTVTPDGTIERIADLSEGHQVPIGIALALKVRSTSATLVSFPASTARFGLTRSRQTAPSPSS